MLSDLRRITPYTITQPGTLRRQLARVHRDGYATTVEEMSLGACSVAVPIRAERAWSPRSGIVVPSLRKDRARLVAALQVAAQGIGRALSSAARRLTSAEQKVRLVAGAGAGRDCGHDTHPDRHHRRASSAAGRPA